MDRLAEMFTRQAMLQKIAYGIDFTSMTDEDRAEYVRISVLACFTELNEALNEVGWKPWATDRSYSTQKVIAELVDAWHFMMNIMLASGESVDYLANSFFEGYVEKNNRNAQRQELGYDGKAEKCPHCHRALDDVGVIEGKILGELVFECGHCHKSISAEFVLSSKLLAKTARALKIMNQS